MKYVNQINMALAAAGVLVVLYVLSLTFLGSSPTATLNVDQLIQQSSTRVPSRTPATEVPSVLHNSTTTANGAVVGGAGSPAGDARSSGVVGVPGGMGRAPAVTRRTPPPANRTLPSSRAVQIGNSPADRPGSRAPVTEADSPNPDEESPAFNSARPNTVLQRPPAGAEAAKRDSSGTDTPTPPTRASMPVQQRRP